MAAATCFMCEEAATGSDHIPPKGLFPKGRRQNLVTVPACDDHNKGYQDDDGVFMTWMPSAYLANAIGEAHFMESRTRALERPEAAGLIDATILYTTERKGQPRLAIDGQRARRVVDRYARGLYFARFGARWHGYLNIFSNGLESVGGPNALAAENLGALEKRFADVERYPRYGSNPEVFYWQWHDFGPQDHTLRMCFYQGIIWYAGTPPSAAARAGSPWPRC